MTSSLRILWLYSYDHRYNFDVWLHLEYVKWISSNRPDIEIFLYGPRVHEYLPKITITPYSNNLLLKDIHDMFAFDVVICNTKSRMFKYYSPFTKRAEGCFLPQDFSTFPVPKIMIEEDYHYEENDLWYKENGFDLLIQRHYRSFLREGLVKNYWLPFGVNTEAFYPNEQLQSRIPKLCLAASCSPVVYDMRKRVYDVLYPNLLDGYLTQTWVGTAYPDALRRYYGAVSCSSSYHITPAKMFEIMASGTVLFTNRDGDYGLDALFPRDSYVTYANDGRDILQQAKRIIDDAEFRQYTATLGLETIRSKHTHNHRTDELVKIIRELL